MRLRHERSQILRPELELVVERGREMRAEAKVEEEAGRREDGSHGHGERGRDAQPDRQPAHVGSARSL